MFVAAAILAVSLGQSPAVIGEKAPGRPTVTCPAGTRPAGGKDGEAEAAYCTKAGRLGEPVMHGPFLSASKSGAKRVEGEYVDGKRTGRWIAYDELGRKVEDVGFQNDLWHGKRTQWIAGEKVLEQNWVAGKRQGPQKEWIKGREVTVEFKDDAPIKK